MSAARISVPSAKSCHCFEVTPRRFLRLCPRRSLTRSNCAMKCFTSFIGALFFAASISYSASSCHFLKSSTRKRSSYCGSSGGFIGVSCMDVKREVCRLFDCNGSIASPDVSIVSADSSSHFLPCSIRATKSRYGTPSTHSSRGKFFS
ncbi:hypothetical protein IG631_13196 [Alternaria alternata]|nr:hypothetical protein IG631_13196 [Alternaria alternata]